MIEAVSQRLERLACNPRMSADLRSDLLALVPEIERLEWRETELLAANGREVERRRLLEAKREAERPCVAPPVADWEG